MVTDLFQFFSPQNIIIFILVMARFAGMMINAPFFSTYPIPMQVKISIIALVAFITYPLVMKNQIVPIPPNIMALSLLILKELMVGLIMGFCAGLIFIAIELAGYFLSMQMGLAVSNVLDPTTNNQSPSIGQLYMFMASFIFLSINGHHWIFSSIYHSYNVIPIGYDFVITSSLVEKILFFTGQLFTIAFGLIMPLYGVLLITDISLGFMSKAMPQMNVFMVALPLKIYMGLALMIIFLSSTAIYLASLMQNLLENISKMFG
ncbi:MAG: flagellar biosynthetic protein FliR [Candidatus Gastranaerophilaceae bacterium]|jgi:flagellar biosynthetic protein FliR